MSFASNSKPENESKESVYETKFVWTHKTEEKLKELHVLQQGNWKSISTLLHGPKPLECMYKWQQMHPDQAPSRQLWSPEEDDQLRELVQKFGKKWSKICTVMNWRTGKQVRERYLNQLQGTINQDKWTEEEDKLILKLYKKFGTKWSYISSFLNGRPENMVKNRFYANLKRRYQCDLGDSDDDDVEEESYNSSSENKINIGKTKKQIKAQKEAQKSKKQQVPEEKTENFSRVTRSKIIKQNDENSQKQSDTPNDDQNNEYNSGLQNITCFPSQNNQVCNQLNIKEEVQLKSENIKNCEQPSSNIGVAPVPFYIQPMINQNLITQQGQQHYPEPQQQSYLPYLYNRVGLMNPFLGYQMPIPLQDTIQTLNRWNQFYKCYNNQILQNTLQP